MKNHTKISWFMKFDKVDGFIRMMETNIKHNLVLKNMMPITIAIDIS